MNEKIPELKRYTSFASLLCMLQKKLITLLPIDSWEDHNDKNLVEAYAKKNGSKTCLALCFTEAYETYHHWKVFSPGHDGVCIVFEKSKLVEKFKSSFSEGQVRDAEVKYLSLESLKIKELSLQDLPFAKRSAYKDEKEYRFLFESHDVQSVPVTMPIEIDMIKRISINPWVPEPLSEAMKKAILAIEGCEKIKVAKSRLTRAEQWTALAKRYS